MVSICTYSCLVFLLYNITTVYFVQTPVKKNEDESPQTNSEIENLSEEVEKLNQQNQIQTQEFCTGNSDHSSSVSEVSTVFMIECKILKFIESAVCTTIENSWVFTYLL